jgi:hypothetical protein
MTRTTLITAAIVAIIVAGFLGYTTPGHRLLSKVGLTAACDGGDCN